MTKYVPDSYRTPQPGSYPESSGGYFPQNGVPIPQRARGPSIGGQQISSTPPFPNSYPSYSSSYPGQQQQQQYQPSYPGTPAYTPGPASTGYTPSPWTPNPPYPQAVNELRPPGAEQPPRRPSEASTHSRARSGSHRSHHSGSHHSQRSDSRSRHEQQRRRRSAEDDYAYEREKERERRHKERAERRASAPEHRHQTGKGHGGRDENGLGRVRTRPTLGDTVYSGLGKIKYWLGPRDKY